MDRAIEPRVIQLVGDYWKGANIRDVQINDRLPTFFRGALYVVSVYDADNKEYENYVYHAGGHLRRYETCANLGRMAVRVLRGPRHCTGRSVL